MLKNSYNPYTESYKISDLYFYEFNNIFLKVSISITFIGGNSISFKILKCLSLVTM